MKLDPSIIALKDFKTTRVFRLKLAWYSTAVRGPEYKRKWTEYPSCSLHVTQLWVFEICPQHDAQRPGQNLFRPQHVYIYIYTYIHF